MRGLLSPQVISAVAPPSGSVLILSSGSRVVLSHIKDFRMKTLGRNPWVFPFGVRMLSHSSPSGSPHCRASRTFGCIPPADAGALSPSGLECCRTSRTLFLSRFVLSHGSKPLVSPGRGSRIFCVPVVSCIGLTSAIV